MANLEDTMKMLKVAYLKKLKAEDAPNLKEKISATIDLDKALEIKAIVHKISGTGGMYGLKEISGNATDCELYLNKVKEAPSQLDSDLLTQKVSHIIELIEKEEG